MSLEIAEEPVLRQCVWRLVDADLIVARDGEALLTCLTPSSSGSASEAPERERLIGLLEAVAADGNLAAAAATPVLSAMRLASPR